MYRNLPENTAARKLEEAGWEVTKRGWPDFICRDPDGGAVMAVEVKPRYPDGEFHPLKTAQLEVFKILDSFGVPCWISDGVKWKRWRPE